MALPETDNLVETETAGPLGTNLYLNERKFCQE
jgi:hypothetical protein